MSIIETKDLSYKYDDGTLALDSVNFKIEKGKTTAILGGNGSGKSTLFLSLNGVFKPSKGKVFFEGKEISYSKKDLHKLRQKVGIVFQNSEEQLFSSSVKKDIAFGLKNMGLSDEETQKKLDYVIEKTSISHIVDKPTHALSFGQKKRVALAGVLAMEPSVIILDEPTAGLDPKGVSEVLRLIEKLKSDQNITVVISTHEIDLVPIYCDDVYLMNGGKVVFHGTPQELWSKPDFLRENNLRLPRLTHLMEILSKEDGIDIDISVDTISKAREKILNLLG